MKILWVSNSPVLSTGYANQTALFLPRLRAAGHEVTLFAFAGCEGAPVRLPDGTPVLPRLRDPYGNDAVQGHADFVNADLVITLVDPHLLDPIVYGQLPWCAWAPIDAAPCPPHAVYSLKAARWIWATARFGEAQLRAAGFNPLLVYHGVDSRVFRPLDRKASRGLLASLTRSSLDGKFIVVMNAANTSQPSRKGFFEAMSAFKVFSDAHPDALLYVHAEASGAWGGEDLRQIAALVELDAGKVIYAPQYAYACGMLEAQYLAAVYNAADVFLSASHGEGFGLPAVEAGMCGTFCILPANSTHAEVTLPSDPSLVAWAQCDRYMPFPGMTWARPRPSMIADELAHAYICRSEPDEFRGHRREHAMRFDADRVFREYMGPALKQIESDLKRSV